MALQTIRIHTRMATLFMVAAHATNQASYCNIPELPGQSECHAGDSILIQLLARAPLQAQTPCENAAKSGDCYPHVIWAMQTGIISNPEWYPGLTPSSSFKDFQMYLHESGTHDGVCPMPCRYESEVTLPFGGVQVLDGGGKRFPTSTCVKDTSQATVGDTLIAAQCCEVDGTCRRFVGSNNAAGCIVGTSPNIEATTYAQAVQKCADKGLQLCDKSCSGTGCLYNRNPVWTNKPCAVTADAPPPALTPMATLMPTPVLTPMPTPPRASLPSEGVQVLDGGSKRFPTSTCVKDASQTTVEDTLIAAQCCESDGTCRRFIASNNAAGCTVGKSPNIEATTYAQAVQTCADKGLQLCDKSCSGTGCLYNNNPVWTNKPCEVSTAVPPTALTPTPTIMPTAALPPMPKPPRAALVSPCVYGFGAWTGDLTTNYGFGPASQSWTDAQASGVKCWRYVREAETARFMTGTVHNQERWNPSGTWLMGAIECGQSLNSQWACPADDPAELQEACEARKNAATQDCTSADAASAAERAVALVKMSVKHGVNLVWLQINYVDSMNPTENRLVNYADSRPHMSPWKYGNYVGTIYERLNEEFGDMAPILALPWGADDHGWAEMHNSFLPIVGGSAKLAYSSTVYPFWNQKGVDCISDPSCDLSFMAYQDRVNNMLRASDGGSIAGYFVATETAWARYCDNTQFRANVGEKSTVSNQCQYVQNLLDAPVPQNPYFVAFWWSITMGMCCKAGDGPCDRDGGLPLYPVDDAPTHNFGEPCSEVDAMMQRQRGSPLPTPLSPPAPKPTSAPSPHPTLAEGAPPCTTVTEGDDCYADVTWAMQTGIYSNPEWYLGLTSSSTFKDFQSFLHRSGANGGVCLEPCQDEVPIAPPSSTSSPVHMPAPQPTRLPTPRPTPKPTSTPTLLPTPLPTPLPTSKPTSTPTPSPTAAPTRAQSVPSCTRVTEGDGCYVDVNWAMQTGIYSNPEWYPGLTSSSTFKDFQSFLHRSGANGGICPEPCQDEPPIAPPVVLPTPPPSPLPTPLLTPRPTSSPTQAPTQVPTTGQTVPSCTTAAEGDSCYVDVNWAMQTGIYSNPEWYPGLSSSSTFKDFQSFLHRSRANGGVCSEPCQDEAPIAPSPVHMPTPLPSPLPTPRPTPLPTPSLTSNSIPPPTQAPTTVQTVPSCTMVTEGDDCYVDVTWAMEIGIHSNPEWYPGLSASSSFKSFQSFLHRSGANGGVCPEPCHDEVPNAPPSPPTSTNTPRAFGMNLHWWRDDSAQYMEQFFKAGIQYFRVWHADCWGSFPCSYDTLEKASNALSSHAGVKFQVTLMKPDIQKDDTIDSALARIAEILTPNGHIVSSVQIDHVGVNPSESVLCLDGFGPGHAAFASVVNRIIKVHRAFENAVISLPWQHSSDSGCWLPFLNAVKADFGGTFPESLKLGFHGTVYPFWIDQLSVVAALGEIKKGSQSANNFNNLQERVENDFAALIAPARPVAIVDEIGWANACPGISRPAVREKATQTNQCTFLANMVETDWPTNPDFEAYYFAGWPYEGWGDGNDCSYGWSPFTPTENLCNLKFSTESPVQVPTPLPTIANQPTSLAIPYCGIAANIYECRTEVDRLKAIDPVVGKNFEGMCMGYGGTHPPAHLGKTDEDKDSCTLNINNDCDHWYQASGSWHCARDYGLSKDPDSCQGRYFFLWDEPMTQGKDAEWAADQWKRHVDKWEPQIAGLRARGTRVTSPLFTDHQGPVKDKFRKFFARCGSGCSDPKSKYYIDVLATNQWLLNPRSAHGGQETWIKDYVAELSQEHGRRPVILGNFAWLGADTADKQVEAITTSRIWDKSWSGLEAVFYFAATDYGGGTSNHFLYSKTSSGSTVAEALIKRCRAYNQ